MHTVIGTVKFVNNQQKITPTYSKTNLVIETLEGKVPYPIDFSNKNQELLKDIIVGNIVQVQYYIRGNYDPNKTGVAYTSFEGKKINELVIKQ